MDTFVLDEALKRLSVLRASDLHLSVGSSPRIRVDGELTSLEGYGELTSEMLRALVIDLLNRDQARRFEEQLELDLAYSVTGVGRFRVNLYRQRGELGLAIRRIDGAIRTLESLDMPDGVRKFAFLPRGLVLVTGPTGSGKSTTLASIIDVVNAERACHVVTIEDPIEFLHASKRSMVNQREIGTDTHSFAEALRRVLRQDPDVILVGELRDHESISVALTAAETGHLVFATLHTVDAAQSIDRIIDVFPPHQQSQVRAQLAGSLKGVISQTLLKRKTGGRVVATEMLRTTPAVARLIRDGETHQIYSTLQSGAAHDMHTLDQSLADLLKRDVIELQEARDKASDVKTLDTLIGDKYFAGQSASASANATRVDFESTHHGDPMASRGRY